MFVLPFRDKTYEHRAWHTSQHTAIVYAYARCAPLGSVHIREKDWHTAQRAAVVYADARCAPLGPVHIREKACALLRAPACYVRVCFVLACAHRALLSYLVSGLLVVLCVFFLFSSSLILALVSFFYSMAMPLQCPSHRWHSLSRKRKRQDELGREIVTRPGTSGGHTAPSNIMTGKAAPTAQSTSTCKQTNNGETLSGASASDLERAASIARRFTRGELSAFV